MSISAMKQALEALEFAAGLISPITKGCQCQICLAHTALLQAIKEAEKQEPVAIGEEWKPCVKLPIIVHVREQRKGETHVSTREGITPVKEDDLIMRGVAGEEYPIGRELFNRTYTFDTAPVHASDISQERVDETAKDRHEPTPWEGIRETVELRGSHSEEYEEGFWAGLRAYEDKLREQDWYGQHQWQCGYERGWDAAMEHKREWVGLTDEEVEYPYPPVNLGTYNQGVVAERSRIVNLLLIQHEAAKDRHNYWKVAAELVQADVASDT